MIISFKLGYVVFEISAKKPRIAPRSSKQPLQEFGMVFPLIFPLSLKYIGQNGQDLSTPMFLRKLITDKLPLQI